MNRPEVQSHDLEFDLRSIFDSEGDLIHKSLCSCTDRLTFADYRLLCIENVIAKKVTPNLTLWRDSFSTRTPRNVFHESQWEIRLLATEAIQHLHSVFDPLASAIYCFNVSIGARELRSRDQNFYKVRISESVPKKYRKLLDSIASTDSFFHLSALSNRAKHFQIVHPKLRYWNEEGEPLDAENAMIFEPCKGTNWLNRDRGLPEEVDFPSTSISIFLRNELHRVFPIFNELAGLIRSDLDMRLKAEKL